jgi:hypothetical protein
MCGGAEGQSTINNMLRMQDTLLAAGFQEDELSLLVIPGGQHNESLWRNAFSDAYRWLFSTYASDITDQPSERIIRLFPNPVGNLLSLPDYFPEHCDSMIITDMTGKMVMNRLSFTGKSLDISDLTPGLYLLTLMADGIYYQGKVLKK